MIWGIPRSKGWMVIRKAFYFILCILLLMVILAACAKSPQEPVVIATTTVVPQATKVVATPAEEVWHLLMLGDSTLWKLGKAYAQLIEKDVRVKVVIEDYVVGGLTIGEVLNVLKNEEPIHSDL